MKNAPENGLIKGDDGKWRCWWHGNDAQYLQYHDDEWGHIVTDDKRLFEKITLEGFQAGLSWLTILRKRENFRQAFDHFDFIKIARYTQKDIECLLSNAGIIRHRGKIEAAINNAKAVQNIIEEFGSFSHYIWQYDMVNVVRPDVIDFNYLKTQTTSDLSVALSKPYSNFLFYDTN